MKCSECSRRNHEDNQFCIYCGTALATAVPSTADKSVSARLKVMLPPQDIDEMIGWRSQSTLPGVPARSVHPMIILTLALVIGLAGVYYWFFYRNDFQILAIDYQTTDLINE